MHRSVAVAVCAVSLGGLMEVGGLTPPPLAVATCTARRRLPCAPSPLVSVLWSASSGQRPLVGVLWSVEIS